MKEIKGFQQPDPKGKDMLRTEEGPWKLYKRGPHYRIGKRPWWGGVKWLKDRNVRGGLFVFQTRHLPEAQTQLQKINEEEYDKKWYKDTKWEVKE